MCYLVVMSAIRKNKAEEGICGHTHAYVWRAICISQAWPVGGGH